MARGDSSMCSGREAEVMDLSPRQEERETRLGARIAVTSF